MTKPVVFMFSGQGSQYYQMGRDLYEAGGEFARWMRYFDEFMLDNFDRSILASLYGDRVVSEPLVDTAVSHPAIFMVETALSFDLIDRGIQPVMTLGVSMGSFAAAAVAGHLRAVDALALVVRQADAFAECCSAGGMVSILADTGLFQNGILRDRSVIAAHNFESHFVVSAKSEALSAIEANLFSQGVTFQSLPVEFAYHSPWIEEAQSEFEKAVSAIRVNPGRMPVMCCAHADELKELPPGFFWRAVRDPIMFHKTITKLEGKGGFSYVDVGPSGTLATLLKYVLPPKTCSTTHKIIGAFGSARDNIAELSQSRSFFN
jgi:bacillaene synthase trans-acting acyltransferase